jgi:hypothetical protein
LFSVAKRLSGATAPVVTTVSLPSALTCTGHQPGRCPVLGNREVALLGAEVECLPANACGGSGRRRSCRRGVPIGARPQSQHRECLRRRGDASFVPALTTESATLFAFREFPDLLSPSNYPAGLKSGSKPVATLRYRG